MPTGTGTSSRKRHRHQCLAICSLAQHRKHIARDPDRVIALFRQTGVINHPKRIGCTNDPVSLSRKLGLKRRSIPNAVGNEMVEAVILAWSKPFRHRLDGLAVTGTDEPG